MANSSIDSQLLTIKSKIHKEITSITGFEVVLLSSGEFEVLLKTQKNFLKQVFTKSEIEYCKDRLLSLAGRYAAKLAIRQAIGKGIAFQKMNILSSHSRQPIITDMENIAFSITHEGDIAAAVAIYSKAMGSFAVGIDVTRNSRLSQVVDNKRVLGKIFTSKEIVEIGDDTREAAKKWAGKEAISKALGLGIWHGSTLRDAEIFWDNGLPSVYLSNSWKTRAEEMGLKKWNIGFAQDEDYTLALAVGYL